jgi:hypothetical protein
MSAQTESQVRHLQVLARGGADPAEVPGERSISVVGERGAEAGRTRGGLTITDRLWRCAGFGRCSPRRRRGDHFGGQSIATFGVGTSARLCEWAPSTLVLGGHAREKEPVGVTFGRRRRSLSWERCTLESTTSVAPHGVGESSNRPRFARRTPGLVFAFGRAGGSWHAFG